MFYYIIMTKDSLPPDSRPVSRLIQKAVVLTAVVCISQTNSSHLFRRRTRLSVHHHLKNCFQIAQALILITYTTELYIIIQNNILYIVLLCIHNNNNNNIIIIIIIIIICFLIS